MTIGWGGECIALNVKWFFFFGELQIRYQWSTTWFMWDPTLVGEENEALFIRVWKPLPSRHIWKPWGKPKRKSPKRTISASGGFGPLQMVSELDNRWCASEEAEPRKGWTRGGVLARMLGPEEGWIVRSHIGWLGRWMKHSSWYP